MANSHVRDFAIEYCSSSVPPHYAVLLKGPWGSGKTWFVERLIEDINSNGKKELYVSLYGLNSFSAIEYEFYRKLHPVLSSKGMEIAGKLLKGALKATLKIDLNMDGKDDGSASISIPEINLPNYLKDTSDLVIIFDDLERCSIPLPDLLGYINHFVEHQDYKVILVANEAELEKDKKYKIIKEKLIGREFEITPQLDEALDKFIHDTVAVEFYESHRDLIKETYAQSEYRNLRHLRQALLDFARIELRLPDEVTQVRELMAHLLRLFLIFTFEIRHGEMTANNIRHLRSEWFSHVVSRNGAKKDAEGEKPLASKLVEKYPGFEPGDFLLEKEIWIEILDRGIINPKEIVCQLRNTKYLISNNSPDWVRLWNFRGHTDYEFKALVAKIWTQLEGKQFSEAHEIKHVCGMMLFFSEKGLFDKSMNHILVAAKASADHARDNGYFDRQRVVGSRDDESALGMGYLFREGEEFREICEYIRKQEERAYANTFPSIGAELLSLLKTDPPEFSQKLCHSNYRGDTYYDVPILASIDSSAFVDALLTLKADDLYGACRFFRERYTFKSFSKSLSNEREWIVTVKELLKQEVISRNGTLFGHCLKEILEDSINKALEDLTAVDG